MSVPHGDLNRLVPINSCIVRMSTPAMTRRLANVCRQRGRTGKDCCGAKGEMGED
jgi:hypothetical protein